jgi:hypothetical protein
MATNGPRAVVAFSKAVRGPVLHQSLKPLQLRSEVPRKRRFAMANLATDCFTPYVRAT